MWIMLVLVVVTLTSLLLLVEGDSWNPVRYPSEEEFFKAKTHERSLTFDEMNQKIKTMRDRRHYVPWDESNPVVRDILGKGQQSLNFSNGGSWKRPNILFILTDDLGYGDLSVEPFTTEHDTKRFPCTEGGILTPELERMAAHGVILTNYHASAPVCSPARASIMTGLYPWRMTAMNAFELGRDPLQRNGFLPQIPTIAEILRENGYATMHSGKWHLGGMREEQRKDRVYHDKCGNPSPSQHGFEEYISELDGPESPRYTFFLRHSCLHTKGHRHLLKDDVPYPIVEKANGEVTVLSDREAEDAIKFITNMKQKKPNQPWYAQVWFNAPHGPWEILESGEEYYSKKYGKNHEHWKNTVCVEPNGEKFNLYHEKRFAYKTMVSAMDKSVGMLLDAIRDLGLEKDTLIVFTSDNGPEMGAGTGGVFREGKRSLMEGGVRVPMIMQWKGTIPENSYSHYFTGHTDILPTFLQAAHISRPDGLHFDGIPIMPVLQKATPIKEKEEVTRHISHVAKHVPGEKEIRARYFAHSKTNHSSDYLVTGISHHDEGLEEPIDRVFLWHKDTDPFSRDERMQSAGYYDYVKVIASGHNYCIDRIFDLRHDPLEGVNLLPERVGKSCALRFDGVDLQKIKDALSSSHIQPHCSGRDDAKDKDKLDACKKKYHNLVATKTWIILKKLIPFVHFGNKGHLKYLSQDKDKATCDIPVASKVFRLDHSPPECTNSKFGCYPPEY